MLTGKKPKYSEKNQSIWHFVPHCPQLLCTLAWVRRGDDLTTFIVPKVEKIRSLNLPDPQGSTQACSGKILHFFTLAWD